MTRIGLVLMKNGEPVTRLVPDNEKVCVGRDLAEALTKTDLPGSQLCASPGLEDRLSRNSVQTPLDNHKMGMFPGSSSVERAVVSQTAEHH